MFSVKRTKKAGEPTPALVVSEKPSPQDQRLQSPPKLIVTWETEPSVDPTRVLNHFQAKKERAAAKAYIEGSKAQRPTAKQVTKLSAELGYPGRAGLIAFVRMANGYIMDPYLTRGHFVAAIDLATKGRNHLGSQEALDQLARLEGPLWEGHGETGASRPWSRGSSRGRKRNPVSDSRRKP